MLPQVKLLPHKRPHIRDMNGPGSDSICLLSLAYHTKQALDILSLILLPCFHNASGVSIQPQRRADVFMTTIT